MTSNTNQANRITNDMTFLKEVAAKPLDAAKMAFATRIRRYLAKNPEEAQADIATLLDALGKVDEDTRNKVVKARTEVMLEIPGEHRKTLMNHIKAVASDWTDARKEQERDAVAFATQDYFFLKRMMVRRKFNSLLA